MHAEPRRLPASSTIAAVLIAFDRMPDRLLIRLAPDGGLTWLRQGGAARAAASMPGAPPAGVLTAVDEIVVLVPAADVVLTEASLSARNRVQLMQALPYAVEEQLLGPLEDLHVAASRGTSGTLGVAVVAKATLRGWLARLAEAGIRPDALLPESLALRAAAQQASLLIDDDRAIARLAPWSAFACSLAELPGWLALASPRHALDVHDFRAAPALALPLHPASYHERQRDPLAFLAGGLAALPLNLLEGEFAPHHRHARGRRWWRVAAVLAVAAAVLAFAGLAADVLRLSRESARIDALSQDALRKAFPDIDAAQVARLGAAQLMRGRLERQHGAESSSGLLRMLAQVAPILGESTRTQVRGIEYRNGVLEVALRAPDMTALDLVRERVATIQGLKAELTAASPGADGVDGRVRIDGSRTGGGAP
jgi:general secretion pathway protein L